MFFPPQFGEIGVDEKVLPETVDEEVIEVMNGCICCTVRGDLVEALKRLHKKVEKFDGVIIETTGLADPAPVVQTFFVDDDISESKFVASLLLLNRRRSRNVSILSLQCTPSTASSPSWTPR